MSWLYEFDVFRVARPMKCCCLSNLCLYSLASSIVLVASAVAHAQILPDSSLGGTPSTIRTEIGSGRLLIEGGADRGSSLFHSFQEFNIAPGDNAYFINPVDIELILTRVTGNNPSNLLGTFGVLGEADVFFINPNGIVFGPQSSLDMGGSFVASTAEAIGLGDGGTFSAVAPETPPLLVVNVPTGLQFGGQLAPILYQAQRASRSRGLRTQPGRTIALLGGGLDFQGAFLSALKGRIELASIGSAGQVEVTPNNQSWSFDYSDISTFGDLSAILSFFDVSILPQTLSVNPNLTERGITLQASDISLGRSTLFNSQTQTDLTAGDIVVNARQLTMNDGSSLNARAFATTTNDIRGNAGNITINASESVVVEGGIDFGFFSFPTLISTSSNGETIGFFSGIPNGISFGEGGDININTQQLLVTKGAGITASGLSVGDSGDINILATESIIVDDRISATNPNNPTIILTETRGSGAGGNLRLDTGLLRVSNSAEISASSIGEGPGGDILINADTVEVVGNAEVQAGSAVFNPVSVIGTVTFGEGEAGVININAQRLRLESGGSITLSAFPGSSGNGGELRVNASEEVVIDGVSKEGSASGLFANTLGSGDAGTVFVETDELRIDNQGRISASTVSNVAQSSGGVDLKLDRLFLDNGSQILVETFAQEGSRANITVSDFDVILLRNGSLITAEAINSANGGNIRLVSDDGFVVAPLAEDSDIIARSNLGDGGEIEIVAQSIFGLEERVAIPDNGTNDIDASSRFGQAGTVRLNELATNPNQEAANLPDTTGVPQISQRCNATGVSSFVATGRGGAPPETAMAGLLWETFEDVDAPALSDQIEAVPANVNALTEAQGWAVNAFGQVVLTTDGVDALPYAIASTPLCTYP
ncbi:two-partner secretion domain-containing protein [Leptothoe spongobia]|uniref:Filamentous hemagglutinin N-terminal domain-containing protein n=1 Tax=Leptothoe spongobia TAU-MAC 1115 TaxID=1967444 RepID=A0A947DEW0_9CYAN|nr:filamentous hemagglutinin N-terminal domain-containing protein [Leptothoe spongobia]MBT9315767.1 filamentous hemagglutinin N-terminal domain-containing protein [Leptothoe spongobia TAU-MAC 1115]